MVGARMFHPIVIVGTTSAFLLGACVGSFLNVCIYRWPLGLKVNEPARSFCPGCRRNIPMWQNIPLLSWLLLRGRCAGCKSPIPFRYFAVELITALVFLGLWMVFPPWQAVALALLAVACIVTVFVDFEHYIIPNQVTWGVLPFGLLASGLVPALHGQTTWWGGLLQGVLGAALGYGILWLIVELGKRAFGRQKREFANPVAWELRDGPSDAPELLLEGQTIPWEDLFNRESDRLIIETDEVLLDGKKKQPARRVVVAWDHVELDAGDGKTREIPLVDLKSLGGQTRKVVVPREAMGMGDVFFLCMAGAFVGWKGVLFTVFSASIYGSLFGLLVWAVGRRDWAGRIPFGPWLVAGLWTWILAGQALFRWYLGTLGIEPGGALFPAF
jgi:leader peptidase (prepilin peptidase)/N-methyltransferase